MTGCDHDATGSAQLFDAEGYPVQRLVGIICSRTKHIGIHRCMNESLEQIHLDSSLDERSSGQFRPSRRVMAMIMTDYNTPLCCVFYRLQDVGTQSLVDE